MNIEDYNFMKFCLHFCLLTVLTRYLGTGPVYPKDGFEQNMCRDTWWTNLLFINNLYKSDNMVNILEVLK